MKNQLSWSEQKTVNPEVVDLIPTKLQEPRTQIYMDLNYIDPQARVLNYCCK